MLLMNTDSAREDYKALNYIELYGPTRHKSMFEPYWLLFEEDIDY